MFILNKAALAPVQHRVPPTKARWWFIPLLLMSLLIGVGACTKKTESKQEEAPQQSVVDTPASADEQPTAGTASETPVVEPKTETPPPPPPPAPRASEKKVTTKKPAEAKRVREQAVSEEPKAIEKAEPVAAAEPARPAFRPRYERDSGYICDPQRFVKYARLHDGKGGFMRGKAIERKSVDCGFVAAVKPAPVPAPAPVAPTPVASAPKASAPAAEEGWVADAFTPERCENGILYRFEKNPKTGEGRKVQIGTCRSTAAKQPGYLNKTVDQMKEEGVIKRDELKKKKDN
jgi:hypothetical protein